MTCRKASSWPGCCGALVFSANGRAQEVRGQHCRDTARLRGPGTGAERVAGSVRAAAETPRGGGTEVTPRGPGTTGSLTRIHLEPLGKEDVQRVPAGSTWCRWIRGLERAGPQGSVCTGVCTEGRARPGHGRARGRRFYRQEWEKQAAKNRARRGGNVLFLCLAEA